MNLALFKKLKAAIRREPEHFDMKYWTISAARRRSKEFTELYPTCGTAACIAGWTCLLVDGSKKLEKLLVKGPFGMAVQSRAADLLQIPDRYVEDLFYSDRWPSPFRANYERARRQFYATGKKAFARLAARIAIKRIDHFIKTGK